MIYPDYILVQGSFCSIILLISTLKPLSQAFPITPTLLSPFYQSLSLNISIFLEKFSPLKKTDLSGLHLALITPFTQDSLSLPGMKLQTVGSQEFLTQRITLLFILKNPNQLSHQSEITKPSLKLKSLSPQFKIPF